MAEDRGISPCTDLMVVDVNRQYVQPYDDAVENSSLIPDGPIPYREQIG